jgi:hypothetical protein
MTAKRHGLSPRRKAAKKALSGKVSPWLRERIAVSLRSSDKPMSFHGDTEPLGNLFYQNALPGGFVPSRENILLKSE